MVMWPQCCCCAGKKCPVYGKWRDLYVVLKYHEQKLLFHESETVSIWHTHTHPHTHTYTHTHPHTYTVLNKVVNDAQSELTCYKRLAAIWPFIFLRVMCTLFVIINWAIKSSGTYELIIQGVFIKFLSLLKQSIHTVSVCFINRESIVMFVFF